MTYSSSRGIHPHRYRHSDDRIHVRLHRQHPAPLTAAGRNGSCLQLSIHHQGGAWRPLELTRSLMGRERLWREDGLSALVADTANDDAKAEDQLPRHLSRWVSLLQVDCCCPARGLAASICCWLFSLPAGYSY